MGFALNQARYGGFDPRPNGLSSPMVAPYGAYRTGDGQVLVLGTTNDREWRRLAGQVLGRPELADDPRYASNTLRVAHRAELDEIIAAWAAGRTLAEGQAAAEAAGLGHARLNTPTDVLAHPQLSERRRWCEFGSPVGPVTGLLPPPEVDDWQWRLDPVPALGEHTLPILRELGFSERDIEAMHADGVIGAG
jgi:crotonobetainyl-CoA:carnitine CoA-transferase CaiB-like acyl-CoA transferase